MSTNSKNIIRQAFLKNFTKKVKTRFVLLEKGNPKFNNIDSVVAEINSEVNFIIQKLNIRIADRQLPYINLLSYYGDIVDNSRVRVFLHNDDTSHFFERNIQIQMENENSHSHILDFLIAEGYNIITISDLSCDAEIVIEPSKLAIAIVDILLDIIMFNSYSFLKEMDLDKKKKFSQQKFEFFKTNKMKSFYKCSNDKLLYYSLAFSARSEDGKFDIDNYIEYWNEMIKKYYPEYQHKEKSIKEQLEQHVDKYELPKNLCSKIEKEEDGAYLILRTNRERTQDIHPQLCSLFGIKKYRKGKVIIRPISEFEKYIPLLEHLDVSAFKIVKTTNYTDTTK